MTDTLSVDQWRAEQAQSKLEAHFAGQLRALFLKHEWEQEGIQREFKFDWWHGRQWRADFAIDKPVSLVMEPPEYAFEDATEIVLIEIEGGTRQGGRHNRHEGYTNDCYKHSAASAHGYTLLRGTSQMVHDGTLLRMVEEVLTGNLHIQDWKTT